MVLSGSRRFSMFLSASCWFSYVLSVLIGSQRFSFVLSGSRRFSMFLSGSCLFS